jgi:methylmalonyl-CoA carboxyltransferase 5S subunit
MFPQVAPGFFEKRAQGPLNLGRDPAPAETPNTASSERAPVRTPVTYDVKLNGRSHRVSVTPIDQ